MSAFFECLWGSYFRMEYQRTFEAIIATPVNVEDVILGEVLWLVVVGTLAFSLALVLGRRRLIK